MLCIIHIYSRQIVQKAVNNCIKEKLINVFWSLSTTLSIHDIRVKKSFYTLSIGSISDINKRLIDSTKKPPTHFMIKENKAKNPQIIKEGTCKSLPELLTVLGRGRNSGRNSESGHWWWVWSITLRAGDQSKRVTMRIRNDWKGTDTRSSATVQVKVGNFLEMSGTLSFSLHRVRKSPWQDHRLSESESSRFLAFINSS